ncbi:MAG TPA: hypothetical protein VFE32_17125 [Puia sp.]|jgi:uncharacterized coiled-coil protein SlyX|nr:hypothetical protein [Puia sp.]
MHPTVDDNQQEQSIRDRLTIITDYVENELTLKQLAISRLEQQIGRLEAVLAHKEDIITQLDNQLQECRQTQEGTRQLINKLLNDISNYQRDLSWYRRTYVDRSLLGILKDRFLKPSDRKDPDK